MKGVLELRPPELEVCVWQSVSFDSSPNPQKGYDSANVNCI